MIIVLEVSANAIRKEEKQDFLITRKEVKLLLHLGNLIINQKYPKDSSKKSIRINQ